MLRPPEWKCQSPEAIWRRLNCAKRKADREGNSWATFICKDILNQPITAAMSAECEASRRQASEELFNPLILAAAAAAIPPPPASFGYRQQPPPPPLCINGSSGAAVTRSL